MFRPAGFTPHRSLTPQMNCGDTLSSGVEEPLAVSAQRLAEIKKSGDKSRPADSAEYFMNEMLQAGTCPQGIRAPAHGIRREPRTRKMPCQLVPQHGVILHNKNGHSVSPRISHTVFLSG